MSRRPLAVLTSLAVALGAATLTAGPAPAVDDGPQQPSLTLSDRPVDPRPGHTATTPGPSSYLLVLDTRATGRVYENRLPQGRAAASSAARAQLDVVEDAQDAVIDELPSGTPVLYTTHAALAGVAVRADADATAELAAIPGVKAVHPITPLEPDNSYAVPLQKAAEAWQGHGNRGEGVRIGIIDSGIDYTHAMFGGVGTEAGYDAVRLHADDPTLWAGSGFPNAKVVGGWDLVGDDYDPDSATPANRTPQPDPNPLDCQGHGTHVAGSAAGLGVAADGETYGGAYGTGTDFSSMRIGPGMAPKADLLAFRVFGCDGSTEVVPLAIDRALDPDGNGATPDAVDVINMSLGSPFGDAEDASAVAANAAVQQGVSVVTSGGNSGDLYDVGGSPGAAPRVITVAASEDAQMTLDTVSLTVDGAPQPYDALRSFLYGGWRAAALSGSVAVTTDNLTGCLPFAGADAAAISGKVALLQWTQGPTSCASGTRADNVGAAGAVGFIIANDTNGLRSINGNVDVPGVIVGAADGAQIRAAVVDGRTVLVTGTIPAAVVLEDPSLDDRMTDFSSRGYRRAGNMKPDVAAVGGTVVSAGVSAGDRGAESSGTSMAAPMVAGLAALVRAEQPAWDPEQVKANIMNTAADVLDTNGSASAGGTRYAPNRVGAGRIDAEAALDNDVVAFVAPDPGVVSVSFGPVEVTGPMSLSKNVTVQNTGATPRTYAASFDQVTGVPGVEVLVSPASVPVPAGGSATVAVTLDIDDPAALTKTVDPTHGRTGTNPLEYLADTSGHLLLEPPAGTAPVLRVPVYAAPRPASDMSQPARVAIGTTGSGTLTLDGHDVDQGSGVERVRSLAFGFELQATSARAPACGGVVTTFCTETPAEGGADLRYVGVTADSAQAFFGVATHGTNATPEGQASIEVYLDTDRDGTTDAYLYNTRFTDTDTMVVALQDATTNEAAAVAGIDNRFGDVDAALFDSDAMVLPVPLPLLTPYGVNAGNPRINYGVRTFYDGYLIDQVGIGAGGRPNGSLSANLYQPGLKVTGPGVPGGALNRNSTTTGPLLLDTDGAALAVVRNAASYAADGGQGLLMLHLHNEAGNKAHVVALDKAAPAVTMTAEPATVTTGQSTQLTVSVADPHGNVTPTGPVSVRDVATNALVASGTLAGGTAALAYQPTAAGAQQLVATYAGDATFGSAASAPAALTVNASTTPPPTTPPATPPVAGKSQAVLTLTLPKAATMGKKVRASVVVATVGTPATGKVLLKRGRQTIGRATLKGGKAVVIFKARTKGKLSLKATYAGDASYHPGTSPAVEIKIRPKGKKRKR